VAGLAATDLQLIEYVADVFPQLGIGGSNTGGDQQRDA